MQLSLGIHVGFVSGPSLPPSLLFQAGQFAFSHPNSDYRVTSSLPWLWFVKSTCIDSFYPAVNGRYLNSLNSTNTHSVSTVAGTCSMIGRRCTYGVWPGPPKVQGLARAAGRRQTSGRGGLPYHHCLFSHPLALQEERKDENEAG